MALTDVVIPMASGAVLLVTAYIAIVYALSKLLNRPQLTAYANVEMYQLFLSALIVVIAAGAVEFASATSYALAGEDPMVASVSFVQKIINHGILPAYVDLISLDVKLTYLSALEGRQGPGVWHFIVKALPGLEPVVSVVRILTFSFTALYGTLTVHIILFNLIQLFALPFLFPIGLVLRFFPPTRDAGIFLIVLSIAFQTMFPLLYTLNSQALDDIWVANGWGDEYDPYTSLQPSFFGKQIPWPSPVPGTAPRIINQLIGFAPWMSFLNFSVLTPFLQGVASISLAALFLPALAMSITIAFVNAVTKYITHKG